MTDENIAALADCMPDDGTPESWDCIDCGVDTAPGVPNRAETMAILATKAAREVTITDQCEIYTVRDAVWKQAGMEQGCLCIGCLEKRLGRKLRPKDFRHADPFNQMPGTPRLLDRQKRR